MRGQSDRVDARAAVDGDLRADERARPAAVLGRIVAAGHVDLDVAEAALREVRLQRGDGARRAVMSGTRRRSSLATARCGRIGLAARPRVAADEPLDVHRRA